jgi:hypothetical protein
MSYLLQLLRWLFPKTYIRINVANLKRKHRKSLKAAKTSQERQDVEGFFYHEFLEWDEWMSSIEDAELVEKAKKRDISLDDFSLPPYDKDDLYAIKNSHYYYGAFGSRLLDPNTRKAVSKAIRDRAPSYRKERREDKKLVVNVIVSLASLIGTITGLVAVITH